MRPTHGDGWIPDVGAPMPEELLILLVQVGVPLGTLGLGLAIISRSQLGRALIDRLRSHSKVPDARGELSEEINGLQAQLVDMEERLDFTERILARHNLTPLPPPSGSVDEEASTPV